MTKNKNLYDIVREFNDKEGLTTTPNDLYHQIQNGLIANKYTLERYYLDENREVISLFEKTKRIFSNVVYVKYIG